MNFCRFSRLFRFQSIVAYGFSLLVPGLLMAGVGLPASAQGTRVWTQSKFEEFEKGTPQGVSIGNDGKLRSGPVATEVLTTPSSFVWSVALGKDGVYLGTGSPASVLRVNPDKTADPRFTKLFETKALAVQVVRLGPDGALYAATIPDGKVYRIKTDGSTPLDETTAEVVFDLSKFDPKTAENSAEAKSDDGKSGDGKAADSKSTDSKARYIWDMTFDRAGKLYVATGGPGAVYRVNVSEAQPTAEVFFKSDEQHIRALAWDGKGNLIAGSDGSGLVYRISPEGKGYVLFSAPRREITSVAVGADGTIYASDVGDKAKNPLPQLPVASGGVGITISFVQPGSMQAANASTALPEGSEIYALKPEQAPRKLWADKDAIVYQMAWVGDGLTVLTGNRGRIFTVRPDGSYSDIAHLDAQQAVSLAEAAGGWLVGTANTGKLFAMSRFTSAEAEARAANSEGQRIYAAYPHSYASDVLDAGAMSRWGRVEVDPGSHSFQIWTRTGNVEQPARNDKDWGWSDWEPAAENKVASPAGRYLQWKVVLNESGVVSGVGINYLPVNSAPIVDDLMVVTGAKFVPQPTGNQPPTVTIAFPSPNPGVSFDIGAGSQPIQAQKDRTAVTVRWAAHDDDGDDLIYDLYLRGDGEQVWRLLKKGLTEKVYSFDGSMLPDGGYQLKLVASDGPSHAPGDALTSESISERFELDTTPPVISELKAEPAKMVEVDKNCRQSPCATALSIPVSFSAQDAFSAIGHAEYSLDAGPWQYIEPVGGLSDSKTERYAFTIPLPTGPGVTPEPEHLITVRVYDRHENLATAKVIATEAK
jgi:WD40 repeat protein